MSKKISELSAITEVQSTDLLYAVREIDGVATDFKITKEKLVDTVVPTKVSDLENDSSFITAGDIPTIPSDISELADSTGVIPEDTGDLTNNAGFITAEDIPEAPASGGVARKNYIYNFDDVSETSRLKATLLTNCTLETDEYGTKVNMGASNGDRAFLTFTSMDKKGFWDRNPRFSVGFYGINMYNMPSTIFLGVYGTTSDIKEIGFRWTQDSELYATNGSGSGAKETFLTGVAVGGSSSAIDILSVVMTSGEKVEFYHNGVLVATHTEHLPTGDANRLFSFDFSRNANVNTGFFRITEFECSLDVAIPA